MSGSEAPWLIERRRVGAVLAPFYAALAVAAVVVSALDLYQNIVVQNGASTFTRRFGSVWWMTTVDRGGVAGVGAALLVVLVLLLVAAVLRPPLGPGLPVVIALLGGGLGALVIFRVGVRPPAPELAVGGQATVALSIVLVLLGGLHAVRLCFGAVRPPRDDPAGGAGTPPR